MALLSGCSPAPDPLCPTFSARSIYATPRTAGEFSDEASQCEAFYLARYAPLDGPLSDAVEAVMAECRLHRDEAFKARTDEGATNQSRSEYAAETRSALMQVGMQRRWAGCAVVPPDRK